MKICFISDTHLKHDSMKCRIPECDLLIHSGDSLNSGRLHEFPNFMYWFANLDQAKRKIFIAGNHDFALEWQKSKYHNKIPRVEDVAQAKMQIEQYPQVNYLLDETIEIDGVKIYGSPWQPEFCSWAFNMGRCSDELKNKWEEIPIDADIVVTHGPPKGIRDLTIYDKFNAGCELLMERLKIVQPVIHSFGHIHEGYGIYEDAVLGTTFINASICTLNYQPINQPILVEYDVVNKVVKLLEMSENIEYEG